MRLSLPLLLQVLIFVCVLCLLSTLWLHRLLREEALREQRQAAQGNASVSSQEEPQQQDCPAEDRWPFFYPGDVDLVFQRLLDSVDLTPVALSRDPWVVQFDTFLSEQECLDIISEVAPEKYWASRMWSGDPNNNVLWRNNSSFLCQDVSGRGYEECSRFSAITRLRERMASVLDVSVDYGDGMALFRYLPGGYYTRHHDFIPEFINPTTFRNCGPRVVTFMAYLTESGDDDGGETHFMDLGLKVQPKRGRAIVWPDTLSEQPLVDDPRTAHEAMRVHRGTKISATQWFYQYQYRSNRQRLCCD